MKRSQEIDNRKWEDLTDDQRTKFYNFVHNDALCFYVFDMWYSVGLGGSLNKSKYKSKYQSNMGHYLYDRGLRIKGCHPNY